jgi:uncharacterized membrane protein YfcA
MQTSALLLLALAGVAFLYASVGHAGASGYIAVLALSGFAAAEIRPLALVLNVLVSSLATWNFAAAGHFRREVFLPLALFSVPAALVGGMVSLPTQPLQRLLGLVLLFSAWRLSQLAPSGQVPPAVPGPITIILTGGLLGGLAGAHARWTRGVWPNAPLPSRACLISLASIAARTSRRRSAGLWTC